MPESDPTAKADERTIVVGGHSFDPVASPVRARRRRASSRADADAARIGGPVEPGDASPGEARQWGARGHRWSGCTADPLRLGEEEVPRSGTDVVRAYQLARWTDGRYVWSGRHREVGTGEGASGIRFESWTGPPLSPAWDDRPMLRVVPVRRARCQYLMRSARPQRRPPGHRRAVRTAGRGGR